MFSTCSLIFSYKNLLGSCLFISFIFVRFLPTISSKFASQFIETQRPIPLPRQCLICCRLGWKIRGKKGTENWTLSKAFKGRTSWGGTTRGLLRSSAIDCQFDLWPRPRRGLLKQERTTPSHGFCKGDLIAFRGAGTTRERGGQKAGVCSFSRCITETRRPDGSGACSPFFLLQRASAQTKLWPESEIYGRLIQTADLHGDTVCRCVCFPLEYHNAQ